MTELHFALYSSARPAQTNLQTTAAAVSRTDSLNPFVWRGIGKWRWTKSLPNTTHFVQKLNTTNKLNLFHTRILRRNRNPVAGDADVPFHFSFDRDDLAKVTPTVDGVGFMKTVFDSLKKWRIEDVLDTLPRYSHTVNGNEKRTYWKWKWQGDELVSDNEDTYKGDRAGRPYFLRLGLG